MNAYLDAMKRYGQVNGRSTRSQYWLFGLTLVLILFVCALIDMVIFGADPDDPLVLTGVVWLAHFVPSLAVMVRRLRDADFDGRWALLLLVPVIGAVVLLVMVCLPSTPGPNRFGLPVAAPTPDGAQWASQGPLRAHEPPTQSWGRSDRNPAGDLPRPASSGKPFRSEEPSSSFVGGLGAAPIAELERIQSLKASGTITEAEFEDLKARLLRKG